MSRDGSTYTWSELDMFLYFLEKLGIESANMAHHDDVQVLIDFLDRYGQNG